jgi:LmbE family N-acetylglucosaminyl deacetylase
VPSEPPRGRATRRVRRARSALDWLAGARNELRLEGPIAVVSPHLDDAVLSLGAAIAAAGRRGGRVTVVTVLAGDTGSTAQAGQWDALAGFRTAGEAARIRRAEDERACRIVGARPAWLPFSDEQYDRGGTDEEILTMLEDALGSAETVLAPGFPLVQADHVWLASLIERHGLRRRRLVRYVEQPYAVFSTPDSRTDPPVLPLRASLPDRLAKLRACRAYRSQLPLLGDRMLTWLTRYELLRGGEAVIGPNGGRETAS